MYVPVTCLFSAVSGGFEKLALGGNCLLPHPPAALPEFSMHALPIPTSRSLENNPCKLRCVRGEVVT